MNVHKTGVERNGKGGRTPCEIWSRVMGYFRPLTQWNRGKRSEFMERKYFKIPSPDKGEEDPP